MKINIFGLGYVGCVSAACLAKNNHNVNGCLLYTSDAADERSSVDLGGRRIIKKTNTKKYTIVTILIQ